MRLVNSIFLLSILVFISCTPKVSTSLSSVQPSFAEGQDVLIIGPENPAPPGGELVGKVKVGDSGFSTDCGWDKVLEEAMEKTRASGANALKIEEHKLPDAWSTCHRISGTMLRYDLDSLPGERQNMPFFIFFGTKPIVRIARLP